MKPEGEARYVLYLSMRLPWLRKVVHWRLASKANNLDGYVRTILVRQF